MAAAVGSFEENPYTDYRQCQELATRFQLQKVQVLVRITSPPHSP